MTNLETRPAESFAITSAEAAPLARVEHTERTSSVLSLKDLQAFIKTEIPVGPEFGDRLEATSANMVLFMQPEEQEAAEMYRRIIDKTNDMARLVISEDPIKSAQEEISDGVIPLVVNSAIDVNLKEMMFRNLGFGQLLADRFPVANGETREATPILHVVGITRHGIEVLAQGDASTRLTTSAVEIENRRSQKIKATIGDIVTPVDFHAILRSESVEHITIHALGPPGTNISQAAKLYAERLGISHKTTIHIHNAGVTPLDYAETAAENTMPRSLHLHVECAVYNDMGRLYEQRATEAVFIDEQDMALDNMQLGAKASIEELQQRVTTHGSIRVATHPSPRSLVLPWFDRGVATWVQASSNSAAARMVASGEADACVTTASSVSLLNSRGKGIQTLHEFGSPNMIFTVASPMSHEQLRLYLDEGGSSI